MSALVHRVVSSVKARRLLAPGDRVICALSGGADSTALAHLMVAAAPRLDVMVAGVVHVNHGLRGAEADADEEACRALAASLGLPAVVEAVGVRDLARKTGRSLEHAAREARYATFERARVALGATAVATGHTLDDQAETILLRVVRGAGPSALAGIRWRLGAVVRPLLGLRHQELVDYLERLGIGWREDASNEDLSIPRNRVRHRVLPGLAADLSPRVVQALGRLADLAAGESDFVEARALASAEALVRPADEGVEIDAAGLRAEPLAIQRRLVRAALGRVGRDEGVAWPHVEAALGLARRGREGAYVTLHRCVVRLTGGRLLVAPAADRRQAAHAEPPPGGAPWPVRHLTVPGVLSLGDRGGRLAASLMAVPSGGPAGHWPASADSAMVDAALAGSPLLVRTRRAGDRIRPIGMEGHRKVQDLLVDRKVPRANRDRVPIVTDAAGRIIWVAGHAVSADFRVRADTTSVLLLQVQPSGGAV